MLIQNVLMPAVAELVREMEELHIIKNGGEDNWRKYHFKYRYGITEQQYEDMLREQNGVCAICHRTNNEIIKETGEPRNLHVDHNHATGKIRGLLCGGCNKSIGQLGESIDLLMRAIEYLKKDIA